MSIPVLEETSAPADNGWGQAVIWQGADTQLISLINNNVVVEVHDDFDSIPWERTLFWLPINGSSWFPIG